MGFPGPYLCSLTVHLLCDSAQGTKNTFSMKITGSTSDLAICENQKLRLYQMLI